MLREPNAVDWKLIRLTEEMCKNSKVFPHDSWITNEFLINKKRKVREALKERPSYRIVKDYGIDGMLVLEELPEEIRSEEAADEYFQECVYIEPPYSMYDCTGKMFTSWYKLCNRRGRWYAYHRISCDI